MALKIPASPLVSADLIGSPSPLLALSPPRGNEMVGSRREQTAPLLFCLFTTFFGDLIQFCGFKNHLYSASCIQADYLPKLLLSSSLVFSAAHLTSLRYITGSSNLKCPRQKLPLPSTPTHFYVGVPQMITGYLPVIKAKKLGSIFDFSFYTQSISRFYKFCLQKNPESIYFYHPLLPP